MSGITINIGGNNQTTLNLKTNKTSTTLGKLGSVLTGIGTVGATAYKTVGDVLDPKAWINRGYSYMMRPQLWGDTYLNIKTDYAGYRPLTFVNKKDMGFSNTNGLFNTIQAAGSGASAGSAFGGWGALAGGVLGGLAGGLGWIFGNKKAEKAVNRVNAAYRDINDYNQRMFPLRYTNTRDEEEQQLAYNAYTNRGLGYARGGLISDLNSGILSPFGNRFDRGGLVDDLLHSNGSDWSNGFIYIGAGGSHELNPNGGTLVSVDLLGTPNLLEEGEVLYNSKQNGSWAFSKRTKIPKEDKKALGIKGGKNMTYADAMVQRLKVAGEMPYDPIELRGMEDFAMKLAQSQENTKQQEDLQQMMQQYQMELLLNGLLPNYSSKGGKVKSKKKSSKTSLEDLMLLNAIERNNQDYYNLMKALQYANPYMLSNDAPLLGLGYNGFANGGLVNIFDRGARIDNVKDPRFVEWLNSLTNDLWAEMLNTRFPRKVIMGEPGFDWKHSNPPSKKDIYEFASQHPEYVYLNGVLLDMYNENVLGLTPSSPRSYSEQVYTPQQVPLSNPQIAPELVQSPLLGGTISAETYNFLSSLSPELKLDYFNFIKEQGIVKDDLNISVIDDFIGYTDPAIIRLIQHSVALYQNYLRNKDRYSGLGDVQPTYASQPLAPAPLVQASNTPSPVLDVLSNEDLILYLNDNLSAEVREQQALLNTDQDFINYINSLDDESFKDFASIFYTKLYTNAPNDVDKNYFINIITNGSDEDKAALKLNLSSYNESNLEGAVVTALAPKNTNLGRSVLSYDNKGNPIYPKWISSNGLMHANVVPVLKSYFLPGPAGYLDKYWERVRDLAIADYKELHPEDKKLENFVDPTQYYDVYDYESIFGLPNGNVGYFYEQNNLSDEDYASNWNTYYNLGYSYDNSILKNREGKYRNPDTGELVSLEDIPEGVNPVDWWEPYTVYDAVLDPNTNAVHWDMMPANLVLLAAYDANPDLFSFTPKKRRELEEPAKMPGLGLSPLRFFPALAGIFPVMSDLLGESNTVDYTSGNMLRNQLPSLDVPPYQAQLDYISTLPFAQDYYLNQYLAEAGANRRGLLSNVGGNRAAAAQLLQTADLNNLNKIGELQRAAQEYNRKDYLTTREYNKKSKETDTDNAFKYAQLMHDAKKAQQDALAKSIALDDAQLATVSQNRSTNWDNFVNNIGALGEDAHNYRMLLMLINSGYFGTTLELGHANWEEDMRKYTNWKTRRNLPGFLSITIPGYNSRGGKINKRKNKLHLTY